MLIRYSALDNPQPPALDYVSLRRTRRTVRRARLMVSLAFIVIGIAGCFVGRENWTMPAPDPPPDNDPYWQQQAIKQRWLEIGCCGGLPVGCVGLALLFTCFPRRQVSDGAAE